MNTVIGLSLSCYLPISTFINVSYFTLVPPWKINVTFTISQNKDLNTRWTCIHIPITLSRNDHFHIYLKNIQLTTISCCEAVALLSTQQIQTRHMLEGLQVTLSLCQHIIISLCKYLYLFNCNSPYSILRNKANRSLHRTSEQMNDQKLALCRKSQHTRHEIDLKMSKLKEGRFDCNRYRQTRCMFVISVQRTGWILTHRQQSLISSVGCRLH